MQSYLDEQMWRQRIAGTLQQAMQNFLAVLATWYLVNNAVLSTHNFFKVSISFTLNSVKIRTGNNQATSMISLSRLFFRRLGLLTILVWKDLLPKRRIFNTILTRILTHFENRSFRIRGWLGLYAWTGCIEFFAVGNHYKNIFKKNQFIHFHARKQHFCCVVRANDVFQSNRGSVVGALMLEVKWLPVV